MNIIHMETEQVRDLARRMRGDASEISSHRDELRSASARLEGAWQGGNAGEFHQELEAILRGFNQQADALDQLGQRVTNELNQWEEIDGSFGARGGEDFSLGGAWKAVKNTGKTVGSAAASAGTAVGAAAVGASKAVGTAAVNAGKAVGNASKSVGEFLGLIPTERAKFLRQWNGMSQDQRIAYLQKQHDAMAKKYNFPPTRITTVDLYDRPGYDLRGQRRSDRIIIDLDNLLTDKPWDIQETIAHESRHEMQHYLVDHPEKRPSAITQTQITAWESNFNDYHPSSDDFQAYWNQPVESDARSFAAQYIDGLYK